MDRDRGLGYVCFVSQEGVRERMLGERGGSRWRRNVCRNDVKAPLTLTRAGSRLDSSRCIRGLGGCNWPRPREILSGH